MPVTHARGRKCNHAFVFLLAKDCFEKCAFAGAIWADEGDHFAAVDMEVDISENLSLSDLDGQIADPEAAGIAAAGTVYAVSHSNASFMVLILSYIDLK
jgi:hypothetical protein